MDGGWLGRINPEVGTGAFTRIVIVIRQGLIQELFAGEGHQKPDPRQLGRQLADPSLNGVSAREERGPRLRRDRSTRARLEMVFVLRASSAALPLGKPTPV